MDFSLTDDQRQLQELAERIVADRSGTEQRRALELTGEPFDRTLWDRLGHAGLLALSLPEEVGGAALGLCEIAVVLQVIGKAAARVPVAASSVLGALPIARFGSEAVRRRWLDRAATGEVVLSAALEEPGGDPRRPRAVAERQGSSWRLEGTKSFVPYGEQASAIVVSAMAGDEPTLFVVPRDVHGLTCRAQATTSGRPEAELCLDGVLLDADAELGTSSPKPSTSSLKPSTSSPKPVEPGVGRRAALGGAGDVVEWLLQRAAVALCMEIAGACRAALDLTAHYTAERHQFGKPIASFQAVGQRAADAYIDTQAVALTAWQAAWRLDAGLPAAEEVAIAKFWADEGAQRVVHACQHLHGGIGVDRDYPVHHYFLTVKHLATRLDGATTSLLRLGELMAAPVRYGAPATR